jgi:hypothetical protein
MTGEEVVLPLLALAIALAIRPRKPETVAKGLLSHLKVLDKQGWKLLVRPDGGIDGVILREEPYFDERDIKRRRFVVVKPNGSIDKEERDFINPKKMSLVDIIAMEKDGGIALTMRSNPKGEIKPILFGHQAQAMTTNEEDYQALKTEIEDLRTKYEETKTRHDKLAVEASQLRTQVETSEKTIQEFRSANETLRELNERLATHNTLLEARLNLLETELESLGKRHKELTKEVEEILSRARERERVAVKMGVPKVKIVETGEKPPAPPAPPTVAPAVAPAGTPPGTSPAG